MVGGLGFLGAVAPISFFDQQPRLRAMNLIDSPAASFTLKE
jgi:hypothetical protein